MRVFWSLMLVLFALSVTVLAVPAGGSTRGATPSTARTKAPTSTSTSPATYTAIPTADSVNAANRSNAAEGETAQTPAWDISVFKYGTGGGLGKIDYGGEDINLPEGVTDDEVESDQQSIATDVPADPASANGAATETLVPMIADAEIVAAPDPFAAAAEAYLLRSREGSTPTANESASNTVAAAEPVVGTSSSTETPTETATKTDNETATPQTAKAGTSNSNAASTAAIVRADGSLQIGDTVVIGDGTDARPYELTWPLLTSVARVYKPEQGLKKLPEWLQALEGKRIKLTGHVVLPLVATSTDELLLTMNPWDGCCVGVPPTAYDALEVTTSEPVNMQGASMYGSVEGTFHTDPYIAGGWLLGLYLLDDARVYR